ncbi:MAG: tape measure protein [Clostridia bacterium]|nr:tape measure protein [Clostridia bacterium]
MAGIEELLVTIASKFDDAGFKALDRSTSKASKATSVLSNSLRGLFVGIIGTIGAREIVNATVKLDSLTTSMNALAGSQEAGAAQMKFLRQETNRLGQDFMTTADAYKNLFSSGKGAGMADSDIQSIFSGVLEAGTVLGSSQQQLQGALTALEQMISKGKVSTQELRLQLGNALPGAMQIAARAMGVTNKEFQAMLESGLDSQKFVMAFANQLHTEFSGKATEASHTLRAELARLQNSIFDLETSLLDGDAGKEFGKLISEITKILNSKVTKDSLTLISKTLTLILKNIRLIGGIAVIMGIKRLVSQVVLFRMELLTASYASGTLGAALQMLVGAKTFEQLIAGTKAFTKASWAAIAPWLRVLAILLLVKEAIDTIRGKRTVTREFMDANPLVPKSTKDYFNKNEKEHPYLTGLGRYIANGASVSPIGAPIALAYHGYEKNKELNGGTFKMPKMPTAPKTSIYDTVNNQNTFTFNIQAQDAQAVANEVKSKMLSVFNSFGQMRGFPQGRIPN